MITLTLKDDNKHNQKTFVHTLQLTILDRNIREPDSDYMAPPSYGAKKEVEAAITDVDNTGRVYIEFSEEMLGFSNCSELITQESLQLDFKQFF